MPGRSQWVIASAIFLAGVINYLDRAALSVAAPLLSKDLGLDAAQLGIVFSSFFIGYTVFCFPGGAAADRFGPKRVLLCSMLLWSVFCGLTGAVESFLALLVVRVLFGMAEGPYLSNSAKLIGNWFPPRQRATILGISQAGPLLGGALAGPVVGFTTLWAGWRVSFWAVAAIGVAWVLAWAMLGRDRPTANLPETAGPSKSEGARTASAPQRSFGYYVSRPTFIGIAAGYFSFAYLLYFFISWFPSYLTTAQHMSVARMAVVSVVPWLLGALGQVLGGVTSDALLRRTGDAVFSRKIVAVVCLAGAAACIGLMTMSLSPAQAIVLMGAAVFLTQFSASSYFGTILDTVEPARVGIVGGFVHMIANSAGIVAPATTGYLVQWTGSFASAFALAAAVSCVGALSVGILVRSRPEPGSPMFVSQKTKDRRQFWTHLSRTPGKSDR